MTFVRHHRGWFVAFAIMACLAMPRIASAQLSGAHLKGFFGLKAGSQAPPGGYVPFIVYDFAGDTLKDTNGDVLATGSLNSVVYGPALSYVTNWKILNANYGFEVLTIWANNRLEGNRLDENPGAGFTNMLVQPVNLGWHAKRADFNAAYGIYIPTGRYEAGADNNTGLGMWGHELSAGTTVYFDASRAWHAATIASLAFYSEKKDTDQKVGDILVLEGGLGRDFLKGGLTAGVAYYAGYKVTDDKLGAAYGGLVLPKDRGYGLGPEVTIALASKKAVYGALTARYQWGLGTRVGVEGNTFNLLAVFMLKPVKLPPAQSANARPSR